MLEINILYEWNEKYDKYIKKYETNEKITAILGALLNIGLNYVYIERSGDILLAKKQYMPGADAKPIESINTIECKNLSFRYTDNTNYILNDITFKACKGEMVAITGRSGSGKSTLLKIISGLYEIQMACCL